MGALVTGVGDVARRVGLASAVAIGAQAAVFGLVGSAIAQYDFLLRQTAAIGGLTEQEMLRLNDAINTSAARWGVAGNEIAQGALILAKAGIAGKTLIDIIDVITQSVLVNQISWESAARAYVVATTVFSNQGLTAVQVFDELQVAASKSLLDVEDFASAFGFAAQNIRLAGGSMEELLAFMVLMANAGRQAGLGARGIDHLISNLIQNRDKVQAWADSLGLGVQVIKDGQLNLIELVQAFNKLGVSMNVDQLAAFFGFLDQNAARAFATLLQSGGQLTDLMGGITNSAGTLGTVAGKTADSIQTKWGQVVQTFMGMLRDKEVIAAVSSALDLLQEAVKLNLPGLRELVVTIIRDFSHNLPQLLSLLRDLVSLASTMLPLWNTFAQTAVVLARAFLSIPQPFQTIIGYMIILNKVLPVTTMVQMVRTAMDLASTLRQHLTPSVLDVDNYFNVLHNRSTALRAGLTGVGFAVAGVGTALAAMGAETSEQAALFSILTGATWGLAAAEFVLMAAKMGVVSLGIGAIIGIGIAAAAIAAVGTYIAAAAAHKSYAEGTPFVPETGLYTLHKGERVLTADENRALYYLLHRGQAVAPAARDNREGGGRTIYEGGVHGGTLNFNFYDAPRESLRRELARFGL